MRFEALGLGEEDKLGRIAALSSFLFSPSSQLEHPFDSVESLLRDAEACASNPGGPGLGCDGAAAETYYAATNSSLAEVLRTRRGLPITLVSLLLLVGAAAGVPIAPVGAPGHFVARGGAPETAHAFLDPFHGHALISARDIAVLINQQVFGVLVNEASLDATPPVPVVQRMCNNVARALRGDPGADRARMHGLMLVCVVADHSGASDQQLRALSARLRVPGGGPQATLLDAALASLRHSD